MDGHRIDRSQDRLCDAREKEEVGLREDRSDLVARRVLSSYSSFISESLFPFPRYDLAKMQILLSR